MLKRVVTLGLTGLAAAAMTASPAAASSHREAPLISNDPVADLADTFMWVDQKDPSKINLVMTANPLENPGDAPNYYGFGQHVRYQFNIDNNGDARTDVSYRVVFRTHVRNKGTFLYNIPGNPVTSLSDPGLNVYQTYSVDRLNYGKHGKLVGTVHLAKNLKTVPNNVGPVSMPSYPQLVKQGVKPLAGHGGKVWAGQTDDPFFIGLGDIGDSLHVKPKGVAKDTLGGMNVQALALQVPKSRIVRKGHPTIGMYAETERQSFTNELTGKGRGGARALASTTCGCACPTWPAARDRFLRTRRRGWLPAPARPAGLGPLRRGDGLVPPRTDGPPTRNVCLAFAQGGGVVTL